MPRVESLDLRRRGRVAERPVGSASGAPPRPCPRHRRLGLRWRSSSYVGDPPATAVAERGAVRAKLSPAQTLPFFVGFFLVGGYVVLVASLYALAQPAERARAASALGFVSAFAALVFFNYIDRRPSSRTWRATTRRRARRSSRPVRCRTLALPRLARSRCGPTASSASRPGSWPRLFRAQPRRAGHRGSLFVANGVVSVGTASLDGPATGVGHDHGRASSPTCSGTRSCSSCRPSRSSRSAGAPRKAMPYAPLTPRPRPPEDVQTMAMTLTGDAALRRYPRAAGLAAGAVSVVVLGGWWFGPPQLTSIDPGPATDGGQHGPHGPARRRVAVPARAGLGLAGRARRRADLRGGCRPRRRADARRVRGAA